MKNLDLIEDEYKIAFEDVVEKYREKLKSSPDHESSRKEFSKNFQKILKKRNKEYLNYINKNKDKMLGMPEKKKKKIVKDRGVYKAYNLDFNPTFKERFMERWRRFSFKFLLISRSLKYNIVPSWLKLLFFKIKLFLSSIFFDVGNVRRFIGRRIGFFFGKHMSSVKENIMVVVNWIKAKITKFEEWRKKRALEKKEKAEVAEAKKLAEEEAKKKATEEKEKKENGKDGEGEKSEESNREEDDDSGTDLENPDIGKVVDENPKEEKANLKESEEKSKESDSEAKSESVPKKA